MGGGGDITMTMGEEDKLTAEPNLCFCKPKQPVRGALTAVGLTTPAGPCLRPIRL